MRPMGVIWAELLKAEEAVKAAGQSEPAQSEAKGRLDSLREEMTAALAAAAVEEEAAEAGRKLIPPLSEN